MEQDTTNANIGGRVRAFRKAKNLTIEEIARNSGVTKSFISRFERDEVQASVATLLKILSVIGVKLSEVFDPPEASYVPFGKGVPINLGGHKVQESIINGRSSSSMMALYSTIEPGGGSGSELYILNAESDLIHILEGELRVVVGGEIYNLQAGDTLSFAPSIPHSWINPSQTGVCKSIWVIVPPPS